VKVLVASTFVPFVQGGSRVIASDLVTAIRSRGHEVDTIDIPTTSRWDEVLAETLSIRLLEVGEEADVLIATRPPSYACATPTSASGSSTPPRRLRPLGDALQDFPRVRTGSRCARRSTATTPPTWARRGRSSRSPAPSPGACRSTTGSTRRCSIPPFGPGRFYCEPGEDYVFYPSRITSHKRQMLAIEAACHLRSDVRVVIAGAPGEPGTSRRCSS